MRLPCTEVRSRRKASRAGLMIFCAGGVATMICAVRINNGSLSVCLRPARAFEAFA